MPISRNLLLGIVRLTRVPTRVLVTMIVVLGVMSPQWSVAGCRANTRPAIDRSTFAIPSKVRWRDLDRGRSEAREKGLPMLVHLSFGSQCQHCRELERQVFSNPVVRRALNGNARAVPVEIPLWAMTPSERVFAEGLDYGEECLLALVDVEGRILKTASGNRELMTRGVPDPKAFVKALRAPVN